MQRKFFLPRCSGVRYDSRREKMDNVIESRELQIERKLFRLEFRENDRGRFLRITEEAHGRRNTIIVPSTGLQEFTIAIGEVLASNGGMQPA
ncbi:MAG: DNA-binding protein [Chthoniobacterales bacterium]